MFFFIIFKPNLFASISGMFNGFIYDNKMWIVNDHRPAMFDFAKTPTGKLTMENFCSNLTKIIVFFAYSLPLSFSFSHYLFIYLPLFLTIYLFLSLSFFLTVNST